MSTSDVLLADIGGTHVRFAVSRVWGAATPPRLIQIFDVAAYPTLIDAMRNYLKGLDTPISGGVFAVAGRVTEGQARMTNHRWTVSLPQVRDALNSQAVMIVNDFAAQARSIAQLEPANLVSVGTVEDPDAMSDGVRVIAGPGTGLGVGVAISRRGHIHALDTEAGHIGFAAATADDRQLLQQLSQRFDRVSNERLISGPGLLNLYQALAAPGTPMPLEPAQITQMAEAGDPLSTQVLERFFALFGQIVGDLVLAHGAWQGAYLTGGMVPRLLPWLLRSRFREHFEHKGRFSDAMRQVPVYAVTHPQPGLLGAAGLARDMLQHPA